MFFFKFFWSASHFFWLEKSRLQKFYLPTVWVPGVLFQGLQQPMVTSPMPPLGQAFEPNPVFGGFGEGIPMFEEALPRRTQRMTHQKWKKRGVIFFSRQKRPQGTVGKSTDFGLAAKFNSPFDGKGSVIALFFLEVWMGPKVEKGALFFLELESTEPSMLLWCDSDSKSPTIHGIMGLVVLEDYPIMITIM